MAVRIMKFGELKLSDDNDILVEGWTIDCGGQTLSSNEIGKLITEAFIEEVRRRVKLSPSGEIEGKVIRI